MGWELVSSVGERARTCTRCYARGCCRALTRARACRFILLSLREWLTCHVRRMHVNLTPGLVACSMWVFVVERDTLPYTQLYTSTR